MVQIAEEVTSPKTLEATLSYSVDTETMPVTLVGAPGRSDRRVGGGASLVLVPEDAARRGAGLQDLRVAEAGLCPVDGAHRL